MEKLLSICMIVKDEEDTLERCLQSIVNFADEIIIVDTGSTDSTKEIARKFTNHVYDFEWINDFSAARNESLKYATGRWILVLDADEYINIEDIHQYRLFLKEESADKPRLFSVSVISYVGQSLQNANLTEAPISRLFSNHHGIRYHRPIHEQPVLSSGDVLASIPSPITMFHTGYTKDVIEKKNKLQRNEDIFSSLKKKSGFTPYDHFTIGNECAAKGDLKRAIYYYERAFQKARENNPWRFTCAYEMWNMYLKLNRPQDAWDLNERFFGKFQTHPEYYCFQGIIYEHFGLFKKAKNSFLEAFRLAETLSARQERFFLVNPTFGSTIPLFKLAHLASLEHNNQDMIYYYTKIIQSNPHEKFALLRLIDLLSRQESTEEIKTLINKLYPEPKLRDLVMHLDISISLGLDGLSEFFYNQIPEKDLLNNNWLIKYSLIQNQQDLFDSIINKVSTNMSPATRRLITVGAIIWESSAQAKDYILAAGEDEDNIITFYRKLLLQELTLEEAERNSMELFQFLSDLFSLNKFELFDHYVDKYKNPALLNSIANNFYSKHYAELSIGFFQTLLEDRELDQTNLLNLALLHFNDGLNDDGIPFLEEAIKKSPTSTQLYGLLLSHCNEEEKKLYYRNQLFTQFPHYRKLLFLHEL